MTPLYDDDTPAAIDFHWNDGAPAGTPVVLCFPGGGYQMLSVEKEGLTPARLANAAGFHAAVVHYRLGPDHHHPAQLRDAARAVRLTRRALRERGDADAPVALLGFSAGGHLAGSLACLHHDPVINTTNDPHTDISARPEALLMAYPVTHLHGPLAHAGSRIHLLGDDPESADLLRLNLPDAVGPQVPPTFLFHTAADPYVVAANTLDFAAACLRHHVPVDVCLTAHGGHGLGCEPDIPGADAWFDTAMAWLRRTLIT